jgi:hypothetical protein
MTSNYPFIASKLVETMQGYFSLIITNSELIVETFALY